MKIIEIIKISPTQLLVSFGLFLTTLNYGQESDSKRGQIFSSANLQPVEFATVILLNTAKDSLIVNYTETNVDGQFQFPFKKNDSDGYAIKVRKLGFETKMILLKDQKENYEIILIPKTIQLHEVKLTSTKPIRFKKDTTSYNLKKFSNGTEGTLEDVIKKLPGLEVSEAGVISFNGKAIYKILIEGDNFFSQDYQILSKNLSPELISRIEAIENYSDQQLLRGIKKSDQIVLNLELDENLTPSLFGNITGGAGIKERYTAKGILFSILNEFKIGYIGNINNVGQQPLTQLNTDFGLTKNKVREINENPSNTKNNLINHPDVFISNIDRNRYVDSKYNLQALQTNINISPSVNFRNYAYLFSNEFKNNSNSFIRYMGDANDTLSVTDQSALHKNLKIFNNHSELDIEIDSLSSFHFISNISQDIPETTTGIYSIYSNKVDDLRNTENMYNLKSYNFDVELNRKVSNSAILQLYGNLSDYKNEESLHLEGDRFRTSFGTDLLDQKIQYNRRTLYFGSNYIQDYKKHNFEFGIIYSGRTSHLKSELNPDDTQDFDAFYNNLTLVNRNIRFKLSHNYDFNERTSLNSTFFIHRLHVKRQDNYLEQTTEKKTSLIESTISLNYRSISGHRFNFSAVVENEIPGLTDLYNNQIITNLRTIQVKSDEINISRNLWFDLRYSYFNQSKFYNIVFGGLYKFKSSPFNFSLETSDLLNVIQQSPSDLGVSNSNIYSDIDKLFYFIRSRVGIKGQLGFSEISRKRNNLQYNQLIYNYSTEIYLISAFKGWINFESELGYLKTFFPQDSFTEQISTEKYDFNFSVIIEPTETLSAKLIYQRVSWPNLSSNFLDLYMTFNPKSIPRLSSQLTVQNIFNTKNLASDNFSPAIIRMNTFNIVPRMAYITLTWNLI